MVYCYIILVTLNDCRRQEFSVTAYTAVTIIKPAVNFDREYNGRNRESPEGDMSQQIETDAGQELKNCMLCPRKCGVDRTAGQTGYCASFAAMRVARASLHMWEEPCISGSEGSGTVFFTGCSLRCRFCQNAEISAGIRRPSPGIEVTPEELADIFLNLQKQGANNINLVTAGHFIVPCAKALKTAKERGLTVPVVYNSSGYELPESLRFLDGLVDIYLPDLKFMDPELARSCCGAPDYPETARKAIHEMVRQIETRFGEGAQFDERGIMTHGVIVRQLLLPGHVRDAKDAVSYLHRRYQNRIWISMMSQYTPMAAVRGDPLLKRKVTKREYERLIDYALSIGVEHAFIQETGAAVEDYIPAFDAESIRSI